MKKALGIAWLSALCVAAGLGLLAPPGPTSARVADIYPEPERAQADIADALQTAAAGHRRVILDFGGNWCPDCHVLDDYFHDGVNRPLLDAGYILVHVNIGRLDRNLDISRRYKVPLDKGVPALAVLDSDGSLIFSQEGGEFEDMRHMKSGAVTEFLTHWKAPAP
jgi:thiol:disulfide interchange protein